MLLTLYIQCGICSLVVASAYNFRYRNAHFLRNVCKLGSTSNELEPICHRSSTLNNVLGPVICAFAFGLAVRAENIVIPEPKITDKAYLDIKIANYTEESIGKNKGASGSGRITIALYGQDAPLSVKRFLSCVDGDGITSPSFTGSQFTRVTEDNLLIMEQVRGVHTIDIAGSEAYEFQGNILSDYKPLMESNQIRHTE